MRFVKLLFTFLLVGVIITASGLLIVYEGRLWWVANKLEGDFLEVKRLANQEANKYRKDCAIESGELVFGDKETKLESTVLGYQLRFLDDYNYQIEVLCRSGAIDPILIKKASLGMGITKLQGSGLIYPVEAEEAVSALVLVGDKYAAREVGVVENELVSRLVDPKNWVLVDIDAPQTACLGWGKVCCDPSTQVGLDDPEERVLDCRGQCYSTCQNRPIVVYFSSDPVMDPAERNLNIQGPAVEVSFGFEILDSDNQISQVTLDYGDGEIYTAKNSQEITRHTYNCTKEICNYEARLEAVDVGGLTLLQPRLQVINIIQRGH